MKVKFGVPPTSFQKLAGTKEQISKLIILMDG
jgi:hypothetical protein